MISWLHFFGWVLLIVSVFIIIFAIVLFFSGIEKTEKLWIVLYILFFIGIIVCLCCGITYWIIK